MKKEKKSIKMSILVNSVIRHIQIGILDIILDDSVILVYLNINLIYLLIRLKLLVVIVAKK